MHSKDCQPNYAKNEIELKLIECQNKASTDFISSIPNIYKQTRREIKSLGYHLVTKVPKYKSVKTTLYKKRNEAAGVSKLHCLKPEEVTVPERYSSMLLGDYDSEGKRILVFCLPDMIKHLTDVKEYYGDGTHKSCPKPFAQIYTLHGDFSSTQTESRILPMVYILMSDMSTESYIIMFRIILSRITSWKPSKFMFDYEKASKNAALKVFPDVKIKGCHTHYSDSLWRKAKKLDLEKKNAKWPKKIVGLCCVLPLLPNNHIREGWEYIKEKAAKIQDLMKKKNLTTFVNYFESYWLKNDGFINSWCVFGERHRSTNQVEAWHMNLNQSCKTRKNVSIMQFFKAMAEDGEDSIINITEIKENRQESSIINDAMIMEAQMQLINGDISIATFLETLR